MDYEKKHKEEIIRATQLWECGDITRENLEYIFPELKESEDEKIRNKLIENFKWFCGDFPETSKWGKDDDLLVKDIISWLEKQGEQKPKSDTRYEVKEGDSLSVVNGMPFDYEHTTITQKDFASKVNPFRIKKGEWYVCIHDFCNKAIRVGEIIQAEHDDTIRGFCFLYMENKYFRPAFENEIPQKSKWSEEDESKVKDVIYFLDTAKVHYASTKALDDCIDWLKSLKQRIHDNSAKTCKNDTLLDLLNKMPSCITVDGLDYHFVMAKHSYYIAYYKAIGEEGRGNAIFGVTAFSPIDLLTEMLEHLKEEGLLE